MFFNEVKTIEYEAEIIDPGHYLFDKENPFNHSMPMLIMGFVTIVIYFDSFDLFIIKMFKKLNFCKSSLLDNLNDSFNVNEVNAVDEKLDSYWNVLHGMDQKQWFAKEAVLRKKLNIKTMSDEDF